MFVNAIKQKIQLEDDNIMKKDKEIRVLQYIKEIINQNTLVHVHTTKHKHIGIPCRILHYDKATTYITIYHVDEKQVYQFSMDEIDDFILGG